MEKAYDMKDLASRFKGRGLDIAEDAAKLVVEETFGWLKDSAKASATPYDDMAAVIYPPIQGFIMGQVDKIDGKVG